MHHSTVLCCPFKLTLKRQELAEMKEIRSATIHTKTCMAEYGKNETALPSIYKGAIVFSKQQLQHRLRWKFGGLLSLGSPTGFWYVVDYDGDLVFGDADVFEGFGDAFDEGCFLIFGFSCPGFNDDDWHVFSPLLAGIAG